MFSPFQFVLEQLHLFQHILGWRSLLARETGTSLLELCKFQQMSLIQLFYKCSCTLFRGSYPKQTSISSKASQGYTIPPLLSSVAEVIYKECPGTVHFILPHLTTRHSTSRDRWSYQPLLKAFKYRGFIYVMLPHLAMKISSFQMKDTSKPL